MKLGDNKHGNRKIMPEKDLTLWQDLAQWVRAAFPALSAVGVAAAIASLRILYDDHVQGKPTSWKTLLLEAPLCGLLTLAISSGLDLISVPQSASNFVGGMVGLVGVMKVRDVAGRWLNSRSESKELQ